MNKDIRDKIAHQQLKPSLVIVEIITEYTREHSNKNIGSESQNVLIVNETQSKTKQFLFNIVHSISFEHSTQHPLQQGKFTISYCKTKQFVLQTTAHNFFPGEKPLFPPTFLYLNQNSKPFGLPQPCDLWAPKKPFNLTNLSFP